MFVAALVVFPNACLFWKIVHRPSLHNLFNVSIAVQVLMNAIINPFYFNTMISLMTDDTFPINNDTFVNSAAIMERNYSCGITWYLYSLLFVSQLLFLSHNLILRCQYVQNAIYGLVINGVVNTKPTHIIYTISVVAVGLVMVLVMDEDYLLGDSNQPVKNFMWGSPCSGLKFQTKNENEVTEHVYRPLMYESIITIFHFLVHIQFVLKTRYCVKKTCPNGKCSAFGGNHRRNVLTFEETSSAMYMIEMHLIVEVSLNLAMWCYRNELSVQQDFFYKSTYLLFCIFHHNVYLPWKWLLRSNEFLNSIRIEDDWSMKFGKEIKRQPFFVTHPGFTPRRHFDHEEITRSEIYKMYGQTVLTDIPEEFRMFEQISPEEESRDNEPTLKKTSSLNWRTRLKKIPLNGELYTRKILKQRFKIPLELKGLPGWTPPGDWDTVLVDKFSRVLG